MFDEYENDPVVMDDQNPQEQAFRLEDLASGGLDLSELIKPDVRDRLTSMCIDGYEKDKTDRADWEKQYDEVIAIVRLEREEKSFPWPNASNVKYPLITTAALQFGARAYPAIVKGRDVVKPKVNGIDPDGKKQARGNRVASFMNWQLLEDVPEWEDETDKLVHMLPIHGCVFRQITWDMKYQRPHTSLVSARQLVCSQDTKDLETVPLFTREFELFPHQIIERMRDGRYASVDIKFEDDLMNRSEDMLECHCRFDLDGDGYDEPYIAIIHKESRQLVSLRTGFWPSGVERNEDGQVRCVRRHVEFVKYDFVPDFEGKFLGVGFGFLLRENNRIINTLINQLIDAGTAENAGGGFVGKEATLKGGAIDHHPGEWLMVNTRGQDLRQAMVPIPRPSPSPVLFQMLGFMVEAGKEMASIRDVLTGEASANQPATTTMAIIEQGLQVFSSIYKRIFRAAGREFSLHYQYNSAYLPPDKYMQQTDDPEANFQYDFLIDGYDIMPVADPSVTTKAQELARAEFLNVYRGDPNVDQREITIRQMKAAGIENIEALVPPENPQAKAEQAKKMELEVRRVIAEIVKDEAAANKMAAETAGARVDAAAGLQDIKMRDLEVALKLGVSNVSGSNGGLGGMAGPSEYGAIPQTNGMGSQGMPQPVDGMALAGIEPGPVGPAPTEFAGT